MGENPRDAARNADADAGTSIGGTGSDRTPDPLVALDDVTKRYGGVTALESVSLSVRPGTVHGLVGPNGAGKTTTLALLSGLARPTSGRVARSTDAVGYGFQEPRFYPELTPRENLAVFRGLASDPPPRNWIDRLVTGLGIEPAVHRRAGDLSGGFRTRLDLALALVGRPRLLLLDEPLADVDDVSADRIVSFLEEYLAADDERAIVVSTHDVAAFADHFDHLTVVVDGAVRYDGPPGPDVSDRIRRALER